jgi:hypothetical protein
MKICFETREFDFPIKLEQQTRGRKRFRVTYGLQVSDLLTYQQAATELGTCLLHAMALADLVDNSGA